MVPFLQSYSNKFMKAIAVQAGESNEVFHFFSKKLAKRTKKFVFLQHQNPPSLSTMLKCAGRFFYYSEPNTIP